MASIQVKTYFNASQIITETKSSPPSDLIDSISRRIIYLQEEGVKQALIQLGWTPPSEVNDLLEAFGTKVFENEQFVVRLKARSPDDQCVSNPKPALDIKVHRKVEGQEAVPRGYMIGSNLLLVENQ